MSRLNFEWREERGRSCFLGNVRIGVVRPFENYFSASFFIPGSRKHNFETMGEAEAEIEKVAEDFVREAGLVQKEAIE